MHNKYESKRLRGEWFKLDSKDIEFLTSQKFLDELQDDFIKSIDPCTVKIE